MAVGLVQSSGTNFTNPGAGVTLAYAVTPTNGNLLVAQVATNLTVTGTPTGWALVTGAYLTNQGDNLYLYWKAASGESNSYTWGVSGTTTYVGVIGCEISGTAASSGAFNQVACNSTTAGVATPTVTGTATGMFGLSFYETATANSGTTWSGLPAAWTEKVGILQPGHPNGSARAMQFAVSTGFYTTGQAASGAYTPAQGTASQANTILLLAPSGGIAPVVISPTALTFSQGGSPQTFTATQVAGTSGLIAGGFSTTICTVSPITGAAASQVFTVTPSGAGTTTITVTGQGGN